MKPPKCFSPSLRATWEAPRYLCLPDEHFVTQGIFMSRKIKNSLISCPPFRALIVSLLEAFRTHPLEPPTSESWGNES